VSGLLTVSMLWVFVNFQYVSTSHAEEPAPIASAIGTMSSNNYVLSGSLGSVDSMGLSSSANYSLQTGFVAANDVTGSILPIAVPAVTLLGLVFIAGVIFIIRVSRVRKVMDTGIITAHILGQK